MSFQRNYCSCPRIYTIVAQWRRYSSNIEGLLSKGRCYKSSQQKAAEIHIMAAVGAGVEFEVFDGTFPVPAGFLVFGSPMSGKSFFLKQLLVNRARLFRKALDYIVYFYGERSQTVMEIEKEMPDVILVEGLPPDFSDYMRTGQNGFFIFDDLNDSVANSKGILDLVTTKCQHKSISWAISLQNAFHHGSQRVNISRAAHVLVIFDSKLDKTVPRTLASRIMPDSPRTFLDIFREATMEPYSYLLCDGHPQSSEKARLRSNIFGPYQTVYIPRNRLS